MQIKNATWIALVCTSRDGNKRVIAMFDEYDDGAHTAEMYFEQEDGCIYTLQPIIANEQTDTIPVSDAIL